MVLTERSHPVPKRLSVTFSDPTYETLERLSQQKGKSMAEVLRDALALEERVEETVRKKNGRVLLEEDGQFRELLVR
jgi:Ribbon-helix-helix protein, copG family